MLVAANAAYADGASRTVERLVSFAHSGCDYLRDATGDDATLAAHFGRIHMAVKHTSASATYSSILCESSPQAGPMSTRPCA